ncbi:hypothetical protein E2C01_039961 [Portunus trituberculatus]|uniref:MADF domain-containing protein n=1 Tax=Portunus trituberculatus TaxID=210409 RepID=A0A5B7FLP2_PORTR|nr:hypothetical protein [Portunus trituberculatus]
MNQYLQEACIDNTMWSAEETLELIELIHSSPALWDVTCGDYKNKMKMDITEKTFCRRNVKFRGCCSNFYTHRHPDDN